MRVKDAVGRFGEDVAARHLSAVGFELLDRNWRCCDGELDIVARDGSALVFVEVKTRSTSAFGEPAEAVGRVKQARLRRLAMRWIEEQRDAGAPFWGDIRFDVVSVVRLAPGGPAVQHVRGAF